MEFEGSIKIKERNLKGAWCASSFSHPQRFHAHLFIAYG